MKATLLGLRTLTVGFFPIGCLALGYLTLVLEIYVPALALPFLVLEGERKDGIAFLYGIFPPGIV